MNIINFQHDGMEFFYTENSLSSDIIGFYVDSRGEIQPIKNESMYGTMIIKHSMGLL